MTHQSIAIPQRKPRQFLAEDFAPTDWTRIEPYYQKLFERDIQSVAELEKWLRDWSELDTALEESSRWIYIKTTINTADTKAQADLTNLYQNIYPQASVAANKLEQKWMACPFTQGLDQNLYFTTIRKIKKSVELFREENIPLQSELSIKQNKFGQISGAQSINYQGEEMTFQKAAVFYKSTNRQEREEVYRLINERRYQDSETLDELLSTLIKLRHQIAVNAGYKNYIAYRFDELNRFDYTPADCERFHDSMVETVMPLVNQMAEVRKTKLGLDSLRPWDLEVDVEGKPPLQPTEHTEVLVGKTVETFNQLDPYFAECIQIMRQMKYLDLDSRLNKSPGGYNIPLPEIGVPFIFMNAANDEHDVVTMVHEGGHAVHTFLSHPLALNIFKETGSEIAEVASMSMELMTMEHWAVFYPNPDDLKRAKQHHLEYILSVLTRTCMGDSFQFWMYENPEHTVAERHEKWKELTLKYSPKNIDWAGCEKWMETGYERVLHFYEVPFYYIEYAFAQLGALAVWKNYKTNPKQAVENYKAALRLGATRPIPEFYQTAGAKFDFNQNYIAGLVGFLQSELTKL